MNNLFLLFLEASLLVQTVIIILILASIYSWSLIITKNKNHCKRLKVLSLHGMNNDAWKRYSKNGYNHYKVVEAGFKYNMTDMQAVIGIEQLKKI